ncbi:hypothetical protein LF934_07480 [Dickeya dadantii]|uniref:hypothetical protein n=1 Tax=Dickeya dadantii TaxID=204038 RepID=UPI001CF5C1B3|nr:hypothetical protein [Dickeya dadantii]MCA7012486.1 hypothetical protein [Dickeya dadantii]
MRKPTSGSFASLASGQNKRLRAENDALKRDKQRLEKSLEHANSQTAELEQRLERECEKSRRVKLPVLNADLIEILGRPNFHCSPVAQCLRIAGAEILRKSEHEQAACIHWMLGLYVEHGENWKNVAQDELRRIAASMPVEGE